jgi:2-C-methyl-D-erythritol 4-phosphate cytidylyltransferase
VIACGLMPQKGSCMPDNYIVLLPCAGSGSRFESQMSKQYTKINTKTILEYTLDTFLAVPQISQIMVVTAPDDNNIDAILARYPEQVTVAKVGGESRVDSVRNGLNKLNCGDNDWVLVHDAVRCCIRPQTVVRLIDALCSDAVGGILATPATDTVKQGDGTLISKTIDRNTIYLAQTPQMFRYKILKAAINQDDMCGATDDASLVERLGLKVKLVIGDSTNIKVTYKEDIDFAKTILASQAATSV